MIGERIRTYRQSKGIKVADFAKQIGVSQGSLSDIENQKTKPSAETISALVRHTDIDAKWLLIGEREKEQSAPMMVAEESPKYAKGPIVKRIDAMLMDMDEEAQRDVLKYTEEKKLLAELMAEKQRKAG